MNWITEDWIGRIACIWIGFFVGVLCMALMFASSEADKWMEREIEEDGE